MGFTPAQVDEMSMWEFDAALQGYIEANSTEDTDNQLTDEEEKQLREEILAIS